MIFRAVLYCFFVFLSTFIYSDKYKEVLQLASEEHLPITAIFLGGDECPWSQKFTQEVLHDPEFIDQVNQEAILWVIPSPDSSLKERYALQEYPQVVLLDPQGKEFARFGYLPMSAKEYLAEIAQTIKNFQEICIALDQKEEVFCEEDWIDLYKKAGQLSIPCFKQVILEKGLKKEKGTFFHLEKFAESLEKYKHRTSPVQNLKKNLLKKDPHHKQGIHFKVALLEFKKLRSKAKSKQQCEKALKPLLRYVDHFAKKDPENHWKAEMAMAEFLYEKQVLSSALKHLKAAYLAAPEDIKPQIAKNLSLITE